MEPPPSSSNLAGLCFLAPRAFQGIPPHKSNQPTVWPEDFNLARGHGRSDPARNMAIAESPRQKEPQTEEAKLSLASH